MASPPDTTGFLKFEDLHTTADSPASTASPSYSGISTSQASPPPPVVVHSKAAKKRKSWGQELPEPKTALPPRKRAKTDDEKEQRRIERIKRNRAAAHNSRERKRQETETLAVALARANAEIAAYRRLHGPLPSHIVLPEVTLSVDGYDTITFTQADPARLTLPSDDTPVPSLVDSRSSIAATSPASPADLFDAEVCIKQEPTDTHNFPGTLSPNYDGFPHLDVKPAPLAAPLDLTQHSAAMLCDLQCRSRRGARSRRATPFTTAAAATWWSMVLLRLMMLQLQTSYVPLLRALWSILPLRTAPSPTPASPRPSTSPLTTSSTTPRPSARCDMVLAQHNAATAVRTARLLRATPARILSPARDEACRRQRLEVSAPEARAETHPSAEVPLPLSSQEDTRNDPQKSHRSEGGVGC